jgi:hypothetical protein
MGGNENIDDYRSEGLFTVPGTNINSLHLYSILSLMDGFSWFCLVPLGEFQHVNFDSVKMNFFWQYTLNAVHIP